MIPIAKPFLTSEEAQAISTTILSGWVTQGPKVQEFEEKFATYIDTKYAAAVSSCTAALHLAMIVAGIKLGDEVICPSLSYVATANCISYVGATPVFAEVNKHYNLDVNDVQKRITKKTKAILLVHQIGMPADIDAFKLLCRKNDLLLIEDAACAVGSVYKGKKIGSHSDLVCFSFHPRKVITTGEGGMITTNRKDYYERIKLLRQHAMSVNDRRRHTAKKIIFEDHLEVGYNYRLTDIQATVGIRQLEKLDFLVKERRKVAHKYLEAFKEINTIDLPNEQYGYVSNYQSFSILLKPTAKLLRNSLMQALLKKGISSRRGIMTAHRETVYKKTSINFNLPISEFISDNSIIIPLYYPMEEKDTDFIIKTIKQLLS